MTSTGSTYLISDLHLTPERPEIITHFLNFMDSQARDADALYILGDLFEYWIGDDAASLIGAEPILAAMQKLAKNIDCFFIAGNRDFLVGEQFSEDSGFKILEDETVVTLYGKKILMLHGDSLCTDDIEHQKFRDAMVTNREWRHEFLQQSIPDRISNALKAREESHKHKSNISMEIMDVTETSVHSAFIKHDVNYMIHGHTHRQAEHQYSLSGIDRTRWVLGDWTQTSSIMKISQSGISMTNPKIS